MTHPDCTHPAFTTPGLTDEQFWSLVYSDQPDIEPDLPDLYAIECARCGRTAQIGDLDGDYPVERERDAFCDDCAGELVDADEWGDQ